MNKSLVVKKKLYLFFFLLFSFFLFIYLTYFLINGERGIISYYKSKNEYNYFKDEKFNLNLKNEKLLDKISRLDPKNLDLDYLDEQLRYHSGKYKKNELIINLE
tara:strand:- start:120 stop:431 length:312 start_codon:yes stop_codon:yes gene_type:complete